MFSPTSENPRGFSVWCVFAKLTAKPCNENIAVSRNNNSDTQKMTIRFKNITPRNYIHLIILTILLLFNSRTGYCHKIDLHIWIAQQVINDLEDDGKLSFILDGKTINIPVDPEIVNAILANKQYYLQGNIGPDAVPGIYSGQMTIHPGSTNGGWGTGDWLAHILESAQTPKEKAFAYGFFGHAASDVFAHTYVNQYSGDCFSLLDDETNVEQRHFLLEGYLSEHMPLMTDYNGTPLGKPYQSTLVDGNPAIPADFLWRTFIENKSARDQFGQNGSPHFGAVYNLYQTLGDIAGEDGPLEKLHLLAEQLLALYFFDLDLSKEELKEINKVRQKFHDLTNGAIDEAQKLEKLAKTSALKIFKNENERINKHLEEAQKILGTLEHFQNEKHKAEQEVLRASEKLKGIEANICRDVTDRICEEIGPCIRVGHPASCKYRRLRGKRPYHKPLVDCENVTSRLCDYSDPVYIVAKETLLAKQKLENAASQQFANSFSDFKEAINVVLTTSEKILEADIVLSQAAVDLLQRFGEHESPVQGIFLAWQKDIKLAMNKYFMANAQSMKNSISEQSAIEPLLDWKSCSFPSIIGIPSEITGGQCTVNSTLKEIKKALKKLEELAVKQDPILREVVKLKNDIEAKIKQALTDEVYEFAKKTTGVDVQRLVKLISKKPTSKILNTEFSTSPSSKSLLLIPDVATRVNAEMHLSNGVFDKDQFNALYNSIVLAKLSLLDAKGLNSIAGFKLYKGNDLASNNIMVRLPKSIDGNHHWLKTPPPFLRQDEQYPKPESYGYSSGFKMWDNVQARNFIFRKLFHGPINPALETPDALGLSNIIPDSYPYNPTKDCPFPNYPGKPKCKYTIWDRIVSFFARIF
ncbi:zinc dependent phospholipase C family protein [Flagellimonas pacifica]|uniref:Zinc dependent phospholipase C n=1 Tax=Flagellimonas pacifica TaxID=1247520 RepID=A0A285MYV4_9FLAO|nr:zinc dependent phospholipase C family protein [Allomuricauda parva]SNZ01717.1 Zinc dependent phospholipase C [Allomuricauda parva]